MLSLPSFVLTDDFSITFPMLSKKKFHFIYIIVSLLLDSQSFLFVLYTRFFFKTYIVFFLSHKILKKSEDYKMYTITVSVKDHIIANWVNKYENNTLVMSKSEFRSGKWQNCARYNVNCTLTPLFWPLCHLANPNLHFDITRETLNETETKCTCTTNHKSNEAKVAKGKEKKFESLALYKTVYQF